MKKLSYSIKIQERPEKVYDTMLGLSSKKDYEQWTSPFGPSSTYEGSWNKGEKIKFVGIDESGKTMGMLSRIAENKPASFVSIQHYGLMEDGKEVTSGPKVESWAGALENYRFEPIENNATRLSVEVDTDDNYIDFFNEAWPKALEKLKNSCEKKSES
jgi:hypothetical protein